MCSSSHGMRMDGTSTPTDVCKISLIRKNRYVVLRLDAAYVERFGEVHSWLCFSTIYAFDTLGLYTFIICFLVAVVTIGTLLDQVLDNGWINCYSPMT